MPEADFSQLVDDALAGGDAGGDTLVDEIASQVKPAAPKKPEQMAGYGDFIRSLGTPPKTPAPRPEPEITDEMVQSARGSMSPTERLLTRVGVASAPAVDSFKEHWSSLFSDPLGYMGDAAAKFAANAPGIRTGAAEEFANEMGTHPLGMEKSPSDELAPAALIDPPEDQWWITRQLEALPGLPAGMATPEALAALAVTEGSGAGRGVANALTKNPLAKKLASRLTALGPVGERAAGILANQVSTGANVGTFSAIQAFIESGGSVAEAARAFPEGFAAGQVFGVPGSLGAALHGTPEGRAGRLNESNRQFVAAGRGITEEMQTTPVSVKPEAPAPRAPTPGELALENARTSGDWSAEAYNEGLKLRQLEIENAAAEAKAAREEAAAERLRRQEKKRQERESAGAAKINVPASAATSRTLEDVAKEGGWKWEFSGERTDAKTARKFADSMNEEIPTREHDVMAVGNEQFGIISRPKRLEALKEQRQQIRGAKLRSLDRAPREGKEVSSGQAIDQGQEVSDVRQAEQPVQVLNDKPVRNSAFPDTAADVDTIRGVWEQHQQKTQNDPSVRTTLEDPKDPTLRRVADAVHRRGREVVFVRSTGDVLSEAVAPHDSNYVVIDTASKTALPELVAEETFHGLQHRAERGDAAAAGLRKEFVDLVGEQPITQAGQAYAREFKRQRGRDLPADRVRREGEAAVLREFLKADTAKARWLNAAAIDRVVRSSGFMERLRTYASKVMNHLGLLDGGKRAEVVKFLDRWEKYEKNASRETSGVVAKGDESILSRKNDVKERFGVREAIEPGTYGSWIGPDGQLHNVPPQSHGRVAEGLAKKYGIKKLNNGHSAYEDQWRIPAIRQGLVRSVRIGDRLTFQVGKLTPEAARVMKEMAMRHRAAGGSILIDDVPNRRTIYADQSTRAADFARDFDTLGKKQEPAEKHSIFVSSNMKDSMPVEKSLQRINESPAYAELRGTANQMLEDLGATGNVREAIGSWNEAGKRESGSEPTVMVTGDFKSEADAQLAAALLGKAARQLAVAHGVYDAKGPHAMFRVATGRTISEAKLLDAEVRKAIGDRFRSLVKNENGYMDVVVLDQAKPSESEYLPGLLELADKYGTDVEASPARVRFIESEVQDGTNRQAVAQGYDAKIKEFSAASPDKGGARSGVRGIKRATADARDIFDASGSDESLRHPEEAANELISNVFGDYVKDPAVKAMRALATRMASGRAQPIAEAMRGALRRVGLEVVPDRLLLPEWVSARREAEAASRFGKRLGREFGVLLHYGGDNKVLGLELDKGWTKDPANREAFNSVLLGDQPLNSLPPAVQPVARAVRTQMDNLGKRAVAAGFITQETYNQHAGKYLPRLYLPREMERRGLLGAVQRLRINGERRMPRLSDAFAILDHNGVPIPNGSTGTFRFNSALDRDQALDSTIATQTVREVNRAIRGSGQKVAMSDLSPIAMGKLPQPLRELIKNTKNEVASRYSKNDPLDAATLDQMGLIREPGYPVAVAMAQLEHDLASLKFYETMAKNPDVASPTETVYFNKQVPNSPKFGDLAGQWLPEELHRDLNNYTYAPSLALEYYRKSLAMWKYGKTILSPSTWGRNFLGNFQFADYAGVSPMDPRTWQHYATGYNMLAGKHGPDAMQQMVRLGVIGNDFTAGEIKNVLNEIGVPIGSTTHPLDWAWKFASKTSGKLADGYQYIDAIFKAASYAKQIDMGMTPKDAAAHVRKWFPDYSQVPNTGLYRAVGDTVFPFVKFQAEAARINYQALKERPLSLAKWLAIPGLITAASMRAMNFTPRDEEEVKKEIRGWGVFSMLLPFRDSRGRLIQWDLTNVVPAANLLGLRLDPTSLEQKTAWETVFGGMISSNPFMSTAITLGQNRDPFFGRPVFQTGMSNTEEALAAGNVVRRSMQPGIVSSIENTINAQHTQPSTLSKRDMATTAIRGFAGIDVRSAEPQIKRAINEFITKHNLPLQAEYGGDTTPRQRASRDLYQSVLDEDADAFRDARQRLKELGVPIRNRSELEKVIHGRHPLQSLRETDRARFLKELSPEQRRVVEATIAEWKRIGPRALRMLIRNGSS